MMSTFLLVAFISLSVGGLYYLLASGLSLIYGLMKVLSFTHGALVSVSAYATYYVLGHLSSLTMAGYFLAVLVAVMVAGVLSWVIERFFIRPLYGGDYLRQILVTMGVGLVMTASIAVLFGPGSHRMTLPKQLSDTVDVGGVYLPVSSILVVVAAGLLHVGLVVFLRYTRHGLIVRAGVENSRMVSGLGIDVSRSFSLIFVLGGMAAGLAGALAVTYLKATSPHVGDTYLIYAFIVILIGGVGSITGSLIAAVAVGLIQQMANYYITGGSGDVLALVALCIVLLVRPQGLFGQRGRVV